MIEINLIPQTKTFKMPTVLGVDLAVINLKVLIATYIICWFAESYVMEMFETELAEKNEVISTMTTELAEIRSSLQGASGLRQELEAYNKQVERLKERSTQVGLIINEKTNPRPLLETIARTLPKDMWIDRVEVGSDKKIVLIGGADSYSSIGNFIISANETTYFDNLVLTSSTTEEITDGGARRRIEVFEVRGDIASYEEGM